MKYNTKLTTGTYTDIILSDDGSTLAKVVRDPKNNKLLEKEAEIVRKLKTTELADLFPDLLDASNMQLCDDCPERFKCFTGTVDRTKQCKMYNNALIYRYDKEMPSLVDVANKYPNGIDERDMVWMFKRLLAAIWAAHSIGYVHTMVLPEHVLLNLKTHGIWLIDWMHSYKIGDKLPAFKKSPSYTITKENVASIDLYGAAMCMVNIMGGIDKISKDIRLILHACVMGLTDAREVHEQLDKEVKKLYGSVFRPFKV